MPKNSLNGFIRLSLAKLSMAYAADLIADDIMMPHLEKGDLVTVSNVGSYAAVRSPQLFLTQEGELM